MFLKTTYEPCPQAKKRSAAASTTARPENQANLEQDFELGAFRAFRLGALNN